MQSCKTTKHRILNKILTLLYTIHLIQNMILDWKSTQADSIENLIDLNKIYNIK